MIWVSIRYQIYKRNKILKMRTRLIWKKLNSCCRDKVMMNAIKIKCKYYN